jgi:hypothetical protein
LIDSDRPTVRSAHRVAATASRLAVSCVGLALIGGAACSNTTLDLFDPDIGLLAHWALDESQPGSTAMDSSGFGLDATPSTNPPTPTRDVPPVHFANPYSVSFNGVDQWVDVGNPALLNAGGAISIAAWVRPENVDGYHNIVAHGYRDNPNFDVSLRINSGNYEFTYWNLPDHVATAAIPPADLGAWVHLCGVFDGAAYSVYRNGVLAASTADATAPPPNADTPWAIGARAPQPDGLDRLMQGEIDDVRIYGRALPSSEVQALYRR